MCSLTASGGDIVASAPTEEDAVAVAVGAAAGEGAAGVLSRSGLALPGDEVPDLMTSNPDFLAELTSHRVRPWETRKMTGWRRREMQKDQRDSKRICAVREKKEADLVMVLIFSGFLDDHSDGICGWFEIECRVVHVQDN